MLMRRIDSIIVHTETEAMNKYKKYYNSNSYYRLVTYWMYL